MKLDSLRFQKITLVLIYIYIFFNYLVESTVIASPKYIYFAIIVFFALFTFWLIEKKRLVVNKSILISLPYILLTMFNYIIIGNIEMAIYWWCCIVLLLVCNTSNICETVPKKLLVGFGIFAVLGIMIQILMPGLYYSSIANFFVNDNNNLYWAEKSYGFAGFTCQVGINASIIVYSIAAWWSFYKEDTETKKYKKIKFWIIYILMLLGTLLTGKRMIFIEAMIIPFLVMLIGEKNLSKKFKTMVCTIILLCILAILIYFNYDNLVNQVSFNRFFDTFEKYKNGQDFTTGRSQIYEKAIELFKTEPFFGIGVSNFALLSGVKMDVHNSYLQVLCEQGFVGFAFFIVPIIYNLRKAIRICNDNILEKGKKYLNYSLFLQLLYIIGGLTGNPNFNLYGFITYYIAVAIMYQCENDCNKRRNDVR